MYGKRLSQLSIDLIQLMVASQNLTSTDLKDFKQEIMRLAKRRSRLKKGLSSLIKYVLSIKPFLFAHINRLYINKYIFVI